jgi:hypothetical protein
MMPCQNTSSLCNWASANPEKNPFVTCTSSNSTLTPKSYPGGQCGNGIECFYGNCTNGTCPSGSINGTCSYHSQCFNGMSCFNGTCRPQGAEGASCVSDFDCVNTAGCNLNNTCRSYFSVGSNETVKYLSGELSFCASGLATKEGVCVRNVNLGNEPYSCNDTQACLYVNTYTNKNSSDSSACECSKGPTGNSYCALGNGMPLYEKYVASLRAYLQKTNDSKCHTLERTACNLVDRKDANAAQDLYSTGIWARNSHILRDSPECVRRVMYPGLSNPVPPPPVNITSYCPKVTCGKLNNGVCANFTVDASNNKNFVGQSCNSTSHCDVSSAIFNSPSSQSRSCVSNPSGANNRYPGEKCNAQNGCIAPGNCTSDVCSVPSRNNTCLSHLDCKVGSYCSFTGNSTNSTNGTNTTNTTGVCASQVSRGAQCLHDYMCQNSQGCWNGVCTDFFSLKLNTSVGNTTTLGASLCQSGIVSTNNTCYGLSYGPGMTPNKDGLVPCNFTGSETPCRYVDNLGNTINEACQCSYDKSGNSYCRKAYIESNQDWIKLATVRRNRVSSTSCHTLNRLNCWDVKDTLRTDTYNVGLVTTQAHNFFYAEDCIKKLFNAGEFIKFGFAALAFMIMFMF